MKRFKKVEEEMIKLKSKIEELTNMDLQFPRQNQQKKVKNKHSEISNQFNQVFDCGTNNKITLIQKIVPNQIESDHDQVRITTNFSARLDTNEEHN